MSTDLDPSEQCTALLAAAVWAFARQARDEFSQHVKEISRRDLFGDVHDAYQRLLSEPSLVNPGYTFSDLANDSFGFYALVAQDDAARDYIVTSLVEGIPLPVANSCLTNLTALSTIANVAFMATDRRAMAALLDNVRREPFNLEGRDMLDWLIGVGDYAAQRLEGFNDFQARVDSNLAMVQAAQALMVIQATRKSRVSSDPC